MHNELIRADRLGITLGNRQILRDVSLTISSGDFITIVGPNGAGKSTLIKCLLGLLKPQQGTIYRHPQLHYGYVPQKNTAAMTIPLSLRRFLMLNKHAKHANTAALMEVAELTDIRDCLDTPLTALSGGQMQRAMMARALINRPTLLVLDEPTQQLDISGEITFYRLIENICDQRTIAVIMVSHDLHFVMRRSRQVVCLYHHICCSGTPREVSHNEAFISLFGNETAELLAVYQHQHDHAHDHDNDHDHSHHTPPG